VKCISLEEPNDVTEKVLVYGKIRLLAPTLGLGLPKPRLPHLGGRVQVIPGIPYTPCTLAMLSDPDGISQPSPLADCSCCRLLH